MIWMLLLLLVFLTYAVTFWAGAKYGIQVEYRRQYTMFNGKPMKKRGIKT
jgi:hypothetical protein